MRLLKVVALLALPLLSLAAKKPAASTFDTYLAKQASTAPIEIGETEYNELTATPRDYSVAVLLTARHAKYACEICRNFDSEWSILGRSWQKADRKGEKRVLLTTVDFDQGRNVFMKVSLFAQ
jgi:oligosaccharyltransferase complex subunit gamma